MTTTTRTMTRKAPWAAALTALLAVLALVFGALAFAGVANAKDDNPNKPKDPGNSQNAPGQQADGTHGNSDGTPGGGNENNNPNSNGPEKVWICHADTNNGNGQPNLGQGGTGGENKTGFNILYISVNAWENGHQDRHPEDKAFGTEAEALGHCGSTTLTPAELCDLTAVPPAMTKFEDNMSTLYLTALATPTMWAATCPSVKTMTPASLCDLTAVPPAMTKFEDNTSTLYLTALGTPTKWAATCPITDDQAAGIDAAMAATAPEAVAPIEAATVTQEPAKVAVPAAAKPLPATVPAGDGSTLPQVPIALLGLLALATVAAVTSGVRMATNR